MFQPFATCRVLVAILAMSVQGCPNKPKSEPWQVKQDRETGQFMVETLAKARTMPPTVEGVRDLSLLRRSAESTVGPLHGEQRVQKFFAEL